MDKQRILMHYGTPRKSGRYPWGSGEEPDSRSFSTYVNKLKAEGMSETDIAASLNMSTTQLREKQHLSRNQKRAEDAATALKLSDKGWSNVAIGRHLNLNESSVRSLLNPVLKERASSTEVISKTLKAEVDGGKFLDVGSGTETQLGISRTKLNNAIAQLKDQGYTVQALKIRQQGTGLYTTMKVLVPPGVDWVAVSKGRDKIKPPGFYSEDGGKTILGIEPPASVDSKRILIRYKEDGGSNKDGVIELRQGVEDISLGNARYAQVRVAVNGSHYMKGMAMYAPDKDFPPGVDIIYNTNKDRSNTPDKVFKPMKEVDGAIDDDNPFGATIRQKHYKDANGNEKLSPLNIVGSKEGAGEEGSWGEWSKSISSQVLSKQSPSLVKKQLDMAYDIRKAEYDEIMSLTNPSVRKALLTTFADSSDSAAVHLKAAALPRQASHVLLPFNTIKETEVYAPNYRDGERVVLIRHPHGGIFEIPELVVNNRNKEAIAAIGKTAKDAIGINPKVAQKLSGADFDGDTVIVIPNPLGQKGIKTAPSLKSLQDFDPKVVYKGYPGMKVISEDRKQIEMGLVSNLITDMTIKGASTDEIARAVKHSMVVIDAEKHKLDYTRSFHENGISALKEKYQGRSDAGAATLISRAGSIKRVDHRDEGKFVTDPVTGKTKRVYVNPSTGDKMYQITGRTYTNKAGKVVKSMTKTYKMSEETDANALSSGTLVETVYARYANNLKNLARQARLTVLSTSDIPYNPSSRKTFDNEVRSLNAKLNMAYRNKPQERRAQIEAGRIIAQKKAAKPEMTPDELKRLRGQALEAARARVGAKKALVEITDQEWDAIQAGAISPTALERVLKNTDLKALKVRAMPRTQKSTVSPAKANRATYMAKAGYTNAEISDALGISLGQLTVLLKE